MSYAVILTFQVWIRSPLMLTYRRCLTRNLRQRTCPLSNAPFRYRSRPRKLLLKKPGHDDDNPASYRPISNLDTISKVIERLFLARILPHVFQSTNFNSVQSAYRKRHSMEMALLKIMVDIYGALDKGRAMILVMLDMSMAFDTIDHDVLMHCLRHTFDISGRCLDWLASYLDQRQSFV